MKKVLIIESHLSKNENSLTHLTQQKFLEKYQSFHPEDQLIFLDLNEEMKDEVVLNANNMSSFWDDKTDKYINLINDVDKIVISTSMVNFSISPTLKQFLDKILVAGKTFRYKYTDGHNKSEGLVKPGKKVQLIMAQGASIGVYPFANFDTYLKGVLNFIGIKDVSVLLLDGTKEYSQEKLTNEEKIKLKEREFSQLVDKF